MYANTTQDTISTNMPKICSKTKSQLADEYGMTTKQFRKWLNIPFVRQRFEEMHIPYNTHLIPPIGVAFIYEHFGDP